MSIYLDASFLVPTLVEERGSAVVNAYLVAAERELLVSEFAAAEARLADFEAWRAAASSPVDVQPADARLAYAYVRRFDLMLRAPDALHLAIARRLDVALATLDKRLADAAKELGVPV